MKKLTSILLTVAVATSVMCTPVFAETGKTVTFNGGHIYQAEQGKPGTIQLELTNIVSQANVKMDSKELLTYLDDDKTANDIIYTDDDGTGYSINSIVENLNNQGGVPVYYTSTMPVITAKTPSTAFMTFWKGDDNTKATFTPKYWSFDDYLANGDNEDQLKVYTTPPQGDFLVAPGTTEEINKAGRYLLVVHDNGAIYNSPVSVICLNVGETDTTTPQTNWKDYKETKEINSSNKEFTIKFNKALNSSTVNSENIYVATDENGQNKINNVSVTLGTSGSEILVNYDNKSLWDSGKEYYLFITTNVQSSTDKNLNDPLRMKFLVK